MHGMHVLDAGLHDHLMQVGTSSSPDEEEATRSRKLKGQLQDAHGFALYRAQSVVEMTQMKCRMQRSAARYNVNEQT